MTRSLYPEVMQDFLPLLFQLCSRNLFWKTPITEKARAGKALTLLCHKLPSELKARELGLEGARGYKVVLAGEETHKQKKHIHTKQLELLSTSVVRTAWSSKLIHQPRSYVETSSLLALQTALIQHRRGGEGTLPPHIHMWISPAEKMS